MLGVVVCAGMGGLALWVDYASAERGFNERVDGFQRELAHRFGSTEAMLTALVGLHHASDSLNTAEFTGLSRQLLGDYPHVHAVLQTVAIPRDERSAFVSRMRESGYMNFRVTELGADGALVRASNRNLTIPVRLFEPLDPEFAGMLGYDVASDPRLARSVSLAVVTGSVMATDNVKLPGFAPGIFVFRAYYLGYDLPKTPETRRAQIGGLVALHLDPVQMFQDIVARNPGYGFRLTADGNTGRLPVMSSEFAPSSVLFHHESPPPGWAARILEPFEAYVPITRLGKSFLLKVAKWPDAGEIRVWLAALLLVVGLGAWALLVMALQIRRIAALHSRESEKTLQQSRERFRDYAEISSDWFWATDADLEFTYFSRFAGGASKTEAAPMLSAIRDEVRELMANGGVPAKPFKDERYSLKDASGRTQWWSVSGKPFFNELGNFAGYRGTGRDVTIEVEASKALQLAKEEAELANRMKSEFIANMSHELRTPLNAVIGFSEMILRQVYGDVGDDRYIEHADAIHGSGQHLLSMINDILDLSKVESGKEELLLEEVDFSRLGNSIASLLQHQADAAGVKLTISVPEDFPLLLVDERKTKQILVNLLNNAIKFTPKGGEVGLTAFCSEGEGPRFVVQDTGIGIAAKDIPTAFLKFRQIDSSLNRRYEGTGLGLPLAKGLVELHGGALELESEAGRGTQVTVRLPSSCIVGAADARDRPTEGERPSMGDEVRPTQGLATTATD